MPKSKKRRETSKTVKALARQNKLLLKRFEQYSFPSMRDNDDFAWTPIAGRANELAQPTNYVQIVQVSRYLWRRDTLARRLVQVPRKALAASSIQIKAESSRNQKTIDRFWFDGPRPFYEKILIDGASSLYESMLINGELILPYSADDFYLLDIGFIDNLNVSRVHRDKNILYPDSLDLKENSTGTKEVNLQIVAETPTGFEGSVFYFFTNNMPNSARGEPITQLYLDSVDLYTNYIHSETERALFLKNFFLLFNLGNKSEPECEKWLDAKFPNGFTHKAGTVLAGNKDFNAQMITPKVDAADVSGMARFIRNTAIQGSGQPSFFFGDADGTNNTVSREMMVAFGWEIEEHQMFLTKIIRAITNVLLFARTGKTGHKFTISFSNPVPRDLVQSSAYLLNLTNSLALAVTKGFTSIDTAVELVNIAIKENGLDKSIKLVKEEIEEDGKKKSELGLDDKSDKVVNPDGTITDKTEEAIPPDERPDLLEGSKNGNAQT